jgi:broad-specificity NMP kinase
MIETNVPERRRCMVVSGIAETKEIVKAHTVLLPQARFTVVRLRAAREELLSRFIGRGGQGQQADENVRMAEDMDRDLVGDLSVDTDGSLRSRR